MRIRLLSLATLLFAASFAQAQDLSELRCRYTKGEVFEFKLQSVIDREPRREARLAGTITVGEADKAYTKAEMVLTDLYAIKSGSGSGASANASKLKDFKLDIRLFPNGTIFVDSDDLDKLHKELADVGEDLAIRDHFQGLFFKFPESGKGNSWNAALDGLAYEMKIGEREGDSFKITGSPKQLSDDVEVSGGFELRFDVAKGRILSFDQKQTAKRTIGSITKDVRVEKVTRKLEITYKD